MGFLTVKFPSNSQPRKSATEAATVEGELQIAGDIEVEHVARLFDDILDTSVFATIIWGV